MSIDDMKAGRKLNRLVAQYVMGLPPCDAWRPLGGPDVLSMVNDGCRHGFNACFPADESDVLEGATEGTRPYSTDIKAAWEVVEKLQAAGLDVSVEREGLNATTVEIWKGATCIVSEGTGDIPATPALAICLAALRAIGSAGE